MKKTGILLAAVLLAVLCCDLILARPESGGVSESGELNTQEEPDYEEIARLIQAGKTKEALELLEREAEPESVEYYQLMELAYLGDDSEDADERLSELYREAADVWPEWQHMQKMAGAADIYAGNYDAAAYRLLEALRLDEKDAETWYYLGVLSYFEKNYEDMRMYFEYALERELSETKQQQILWYAAQAGDRE